MWTDLFTPISEELVTKVECVILVIFHIVAGTEQATAAVGAGTLNAAKAS